MASSMFDNSSLYIVPSGIKAGTVFPIKPLGTANLDFTRALDTATRVGPDGLIEKVRTNLVLQSQTFDDAGWTKAGCAVTANTTIAPDGTLTGDLIVENDAASTQHRLFQGSTVANNTEHTTSVFVKRVTGTRDFAIINIVSGARVYFNLTTGAVGDEVLGKGSIQDVGNGWFRCTATGVSTGTSLSIFLALTTAATNASETYSGDGVSSLAFWGAQLETGVATPYIPTTTAAVSVGMTQNIPRIDYTGGGCGKLLLEPQRQNLVRFSEQIDNAAWGKTQLNTTGTPPFINAATSPDGTTSAEKLIKTSATADSFAVQTVSISVSGTYTFSAFFKYSGTQFVRFLTALSSAPFTNYGRVFFDILNGTVVDAQVGTAKVEDYGNGWYRCSMTYTNPSGGTFFRISPTTSGSSVVTAGNDIDAVLVWGAQLELGSFATSYIPTLGAAVTRSADAASKTGISALIGQTEGTLFAEVNVSTLQGAVARTFIDIGAASNRVFVGFTSLASNTIRLQIDTSVGQQVDFRGVVTSTGAIKVAAAYKDGDCALFINGVAGTELANNSISFSTISNLFLGQTITGGALLGDGINQALLFKTRLTNAQLAELTA